jgi:transposase-like protein
MRTFSESFKRKMVQRMLMPGGPSATALAKDVGIGQSTLSRWLRQLGSVSVVSDKRTAGTASGPRRPEDWSAQERLRAVMESSRLSGEELGEFLRREGLHEETLSEWRKSALEALGSQSPRGGDKKRIKQLERQLARKDKALAEAAALLVLQKKVREIWGDADDDTDVENER